MNPDITTIIPTFRRPTLLKRALESVLTQTYPHFQVIVCDNASNDETEAVVQNFASADPRVIYHQHKDNIGMMKNYEYGFSQVSSPYFSFLSDDDYLSPWFYETALQDFTRFPDIAFSICKVYAVNKSDEIIMDSLCLWEKHGYFSAPNGFLEFISPSLKTPLPTCTLFHKKICASILPDWDPQMQHLWDHDFFLRLSSAYPYFINEKACGFFLAHEDGFSSGFFKRLKHFSKECTLYRRTFERLIQKINTNSFLSQSMKKQAQESLRKSCENMIQHYCGNKPSLIQKISNLIKVIKA